MQDLSFLAVPALGLGIGVIVGFFVRRARLCSFGAVESALIGGDWRRMKVFALSLGIALAGTQLLIAVGWLDPLRTTYVASRFAWLSIALGALMFGFGMALVGTCAFGSLIRLGGGDLRSLVVLIVFGAVGYSVLRGALASLRITTIEQVALALPDHRPAMLSGQVTGGWGLAIVLAVVLVGLAISERRLWKAPRLVTAGVVLGLGVVAGWLVTAPVVDDFTAPSRVQSLTYVAPVARALFGVILGGSGWLDFGVANVMGVPIGAWLAARLAREFHWEAFDDAREMRRHLLGAVLMGVGGILAGGCTIGQGLTAGSLTAASWLLAVPGVMLGARLGIAFLVEGSFLGLIQTWITPSKS